MIEYELAMYKPGSMTYKETGVKKHLEKTILDYFDHICDSTKDWEMLRSTDMARNLLHFPDHEGHCSVYLHNGEEIKLEKVNK